MDPYLEAHWGDVHTSLMTYARDQLRAQLPGDLKVRVEEKISVLDPDEEEDRPVGYFPDLRIIERAEPTSPVLQEISSVAVADPILVPRMAEPQTERTLQIVDSRSGNRIITTIEILSPANKNDLKGRTAYRKKQKQLEEAGVNLVEIDLLREGGYVLIPPLEVVPKSCLGTYRIVVSRATDPENVEMYRVPLRKRLPIIRVPLRPGDSDAKLDLQSLINAAYENGGYDDTDYRLEPEPPFLPEDAEWAATLLSEAKRR